MNVIQGIAHALSLSNLVYCFVGCVLGTLVGVLPGLGPAATLAILLPLTMYLDPTGSIIMLAGLAYGAMYGGSTTSILVNIPGEAASVATAWDGFAMTKKGRGGQALWIAAVGSFIAGTIGVIGMSFIGPGMAKFALGFGPPEYFGLFLVSMTLLISLSGASMLKGLAAGLVGILLAGIGLDPVTGLTRFGFGITDLMRGFDLVSIAIGIYGIAEILTSAEAGIVKIYEGKLGKMMPRGKELKKGLLASLRATVVGFPMGLLPGLNPIVSSFLAYDLEKKISKHPEEFGKGAIEGVAAPEAANNATAQAGFIPLMCLGIPSNPVTAIILAALMMNGLKPGPVFFVQNSDFFWTVVGSMYIGNIMLLILNLPLVGIWARVSTIPYKYLAPTILALCVVGAYASRSTLFDVWVALAAGVVGYIMRKKNWPQAPLLVGFILGDMVEISLRQSLSLGGPLIFLTRPIALILLVLTVILAILSIMFMKRTPKGATTEG
jgi:putative tricarboxylic transport membrane protein